MQYKTLKLGTLDSLIPIVFSHLFPQIDDLPNAGDIYLQLDRAPPHYSNLVRVALDDKFPDNWIGRNGPILWPPRSQDLTVLDFFFRGYIKNILYAEKIRDLQHLKDRMCAAIFSHARDAFSCMGGS
jgi:hypothetical protein